jgi:hypothetical protein
MTAKYETPQNGVALAGCGKNLKAKGGYDPPAPQCRPFVSLLKHS